MELCVAACQVLTYPQVEKSADKIVEWIRKAADRNVDVVAFPEGALCGFSCGEEYWNRAVPADFAAAEGRIIEASRELGIAVVLGTAHWDGAARFNSILAIDKGGKVRGRYAKAYLAEGWSTPGRRLPVYSLAGVRSCFVICHDIRYPGLVRLPSAAGAQICYFCSNESGLLHEHKLSAYRAMPIARATENQIFVVMANAPADPDDVHSSSQSHGNSKIIHPDGNVLCEAGHFEESLVTCRINLDDATRSVAKRVMEEEAILKEWIQQGITLVTGQDQTE